MLGCGNSSRSELSHAANLPLTAFVLAVLAFALLVVGVHAALPSDEDRLKQTNVQTDNRSLFALIRPRTPPEPAAIADLIRKLGNDQFKQREEAERALRAIGRPALPALDKAATDPDAEIARRAKDCRETIVQQLGPQAEQALLAVRLLLRRAPHGVVAALLEHLPAAPSTDVEEAIWFGIDALAARAKEFDPALVAGLTDPHPARRALAACLVGRLGDARQKDSVRRLLNDKDPNVRLLRRPGFARRPGRCRRTGADRLAGSAGYGAGLAGRGVAALPGRGNGCREHCCGRGARGTSALPQGVATLV